MATSIADLGNKLGDIEYSVKDFIGRHERVAKEQAARTLAIEQLIAAKGGAWGGGGPFASDSLGATIIKDEGFLLTQKGSARSSGRIAVPGFAKAVTITTGPWSVQPDRLPYITFPPQRKLTVRDLLPAVQTTSNLVEYPVESAQSGGADYQVNEGDTKTQTDFTYQLKSAPVVTIAVWLACSRQVFEDSNAFSGYLDARLVYNVERKIEDEFLYGPGTTGNLNGLMTQATTYAGSATDLVDKVAGMIAQLAANNVTADAVVINPVDWWAMRTQKASTAGTFLVGDPLSPFPLSLWGLRVALSTGINPGDVLVGDFRTGAILFDRQQDVVEVSREHSDFFVRNLVAVLAESRLALAVLYPPAFVKLTGSGS